MPYVVPTFNLIANLWRNPWVVPPIGAPALVVPCQLRVYRAYIDSSILLLPALTDIRDDQVGSFADLVEVPAGSGRFYQVLWVDDVAKGFANEYRGAHIYKTGIWPIPIP
jgi:hypothetical protein